MDSKNITNDEQSFDFAPGVLGVQERPPSPLPRIVLRGMLLLLTALLLWSFFGRLDIVSVAEGKLVPVSYLKIVQPADSGIVREIAIEEGQHVEKGQLLIRMDGNISEADTKTIQSELQYRDLELRRIEAELAGAELKRKDDDPVEMFDRVYAEFQSNKRAMRDDIAAEQAALQRAHSDLAATRELQTKLEQTLPSLKAEEQTYNDLVEEGYVEKVKSFEKQRARIENEQDLRAQEFNAKSLQAAIAQSQKRINQIKSSYRQKLETDRVAIYAEHQKLEQEWAKQSHKNSLLELRAPQAGTIKDLATHTTGTVVSPGTVLMSLVPSNEALQAEVWLKNEDAGFVRKGQEVKVKLMAYPFQKYGMIDGDVIQVSADATDRPQPQSQGEEDEQSSLRPSSYKTIVKLKNQILTFDGNELEITPGMQVAAEIKLADQTVMQYLLSPVRKAFHDAARER